MEEFKLMNVKGTCDFLPEEQLIRNRITDLLKKTFEKYGFLPLETPMLCYYDLLASKYAGGAEILKEVYKFKDQGHRDLGLRYDLTVPFSKVLGINKGLILPFKRYEIGKVFRDGPVKLGRNREFYQCDVDACGLETPYAECEYFNMIVDVFNELNIDIEIRYNNRKFLNGLLLYCGVDEDNLSAFITSIDKLDKVPKEEIVKEITTHTSNKIIDKVFEMFDYSFDTIYKETYNKSNKLLDEGLLELSKLNELIKDLNMGRVCVFTPFLARGLDIYTGSVWEIYDKEKRITSSLGAGGRYDRIITNFLNNGNEYPAVGMTFGLEPIYEIVKLNEKEVINKYDVYVYSFDRDAYMYKVSNVLRKSGYKVLTELNDIKLKKAMNIANRENIKYVIIIGEDEIKNNSVSLKNMISGEQKLVKLDDIIKEISK